MNKLIGAGAAVAAIALACLTFSEKIAGIDALPLGVIAAASALVVLARRRR